MLVLALKFSRDAKRRPARGAFADVWPAAAPKAAWQKGRVSVPSKRNRELSKRSGLGLRPSVPRSHRGKPRLDDAVINVGVANRNDWSVDSLERR
jgi:hypothetical protein